jgi:hypothetical protein
MRGRPGVVLSPRKVSGSFGSFFPSIHLSLDTASDAMGCVTGVSKRRDTANHFDTAALSAKGTCSLGVSPSLGAAELIPPGLTSAAIA